jgi:hypothetical protein
MPVDFPASTKQPVCEVCGKPATLGARSLARWPNLRTGFWEYVVNGGFHWGCDEHPPESTITTVDNPCDLGIHSDRP